MKEFWSEVVQKFAAVFLRFMDEHPGKTIGSLIGFILGLLVVLLGFWRSIILLAFILIGFILGKRHDDHKHLFDWVDRFLD